MTSSPSCVTQLFQQSWIYQMIPRHSQHQNLPTEYQLGLWVMRMCLLVIVILKRNYFCTKRLKKYEEEMYSLIANKLYLLLVILICFPLISKVDSSTTLRVPSKTPCVESYLNMYAWDITIKHHELHKADTQLTLITWRTNFTRTISLFYVRHLLCQ